MSDEGKRILRQLSKRQQEAVKYIDGPLLVLAGAGSGKTRVLTHKIAWLVAEGITNPENILAVTFTNKAAGEMRSRIGLLLNNANAAKVQAGTFHAFGLKFLFRHPRETEEIAGVRKDFTIFDRNDCKNLLHDLMKEMKFSDKENAPAAALEIISKDYMSWSPNKFETELDENYFKLAGAYRKKLRENNALDFDDLMILPLEILKQDRNIREWEREKIRWLLVDEYQDVNRPQYLLLRYLAGDKCTVNVVGDPDQSIYGWRGAELGMILNFEEDFDGAKTIVLDENYRSTGNILAASNALIHNNTARLKKDLFTSRGEGEKIYTLLAQSDFQESDFIVAEIERLCRVHNYAYSDIAILYRQNAMSRLYEQKFLEEHIPYRIIRGMSFYERLEVKDVLAILKTAVNPFDRPAMERASGFAVKGMGPKKRAEWEEWLTNLKEEDPVKIWSIVAGGAWKVSGVVNESIKSFATHMCAILDLADEGIKPAVDYVLHEMQYETFLRLKDPESYQDRIQNVKELKSIVPDGNLYETLAEAALFTDADAQNSNESNSVGLLTLHASKGLEFPVVFIVGLEESVFPNTKAKENPEELEEERRLFYVGMTRAEERLYLTASRKRKLYGGVHENDFSRFLFEIPDECKKVDDRGRAFTPRRPKTIYRNNNYGGYSNYGRYRGW